MSNAMEEAIKAVRKKFGNSSIMSMYDAPQDVEAISTGSLILDQITGIGGIPRGRITEIYGNESSGKTTIALQAIAQAQKMGLPCLFVDVEQGLDLQYAKQLGVSDRPELFMFSQPECGEDALEICRECIISGAFGIVVVDSVAAMSPKAEIEGDISDATIGSQARLMGKAMRILASAVKKNNVALVMINQVREKIGILYGDNTVTPGGRALKFSSSMRIRLHQSAKIGKKGEETGHAVKAAITKNKLAPPFRAGEFNINFGTGVDPLPEIVKIGIDAGLWQLKGSWYAIDGENVAQGAEKMSEYISDSGKVDEYYNICHEFVNSRHQKGETTEVN